MLGENLIIFVVIRSEKKSFADITYVVEFPESTGDVADLFRHFFLQFLNLLGADGTSLSKKMFRVKAYHRKRKTYFKE